MTDADRRRPPDRFCTSVDEFTREALSTNADLSLTANDTTVLLDKIVVGPGRRPQHLHMDKQHLRMNNRPALTANAMRDWCRFAPHRDYVRRTRSILAERLTESPTAASAYAATDLDGVVSPAAIVTDWEREARGLGVDSLATSVPVRLDPPGRGTDRILTVDERQSPTPMVLEADGALRVLDPKE